MDVSQVWPKLYTTAKVYATLGNGGMIWEKSFC